MIHTLHMHGIHVGALLEAIDCLEERDCILSPEGEEVRDMLSRAMSAEIDRGLNIIQTEAYQRYDS